MATRQPTIEQNSHFTSKTKEGQDVEFEATLKFYITPSGQVTLSVPGGHQSNRSTTVVAPLPQQSSPSSAGRQEINRSESSANSRRQEVDRSGGGENSGRQDVDRSGSGVRIQAEKRIMRDDTIDKAFPRGPEPSCECAIKEFIPDPCKAVDDALKSIKLIYNNIFSGPRCPPPMNIDILYEDYRPFNNNSENDYSEKSAGIVDKESNKNKEMMGNEQKYDMQANTTNN